MFKDQQGGGADFVGCKIRLIYFNPCTFRITELLDIYIILISKIKKKNDLGARIEIKTFSTPIVFTTTRANSTVKL